MKQKKANKILLKVRGDYETIADDFSKNRQYLWPDFKYLKPYIRPGQNILDLGCGNGRLFELLKNYNINYTGIDNCARFIQIAQDKWRQPPIYGEKNKVPVFKNGDVLNFQSKPEYYDTVFLVAVLQHIPSQKYRFQVLKNIFYALKKGGTLLMTNWNLWQKKYRKYIYCNNLKKCLGLSKMDINDSFIPWQSDIKRYYHAFTAKELNQLLKQTGFKINENFTGKMNIVTIAKRP